MKALLVPALALTLAACAPATKPVTATVAATPKPPATSAMGKPTPEVTPVPPVIAFPGNEEFRTRQPDPDAVHPFAQPKIEIFPLGNGVTVYLVERHELPTVSINLTFEGGSVDDPAGHEGEASLCMSLANEGTQKLDRLAFEEALADLGSGVGAAAGLDQQYVTASSLSKNLDATLDLWADTLLHPGMRKDELDRDISRRVEAIRQSKGSPGGVAGRIASPILWGDGHPYAHLPTENSVKAVTVESCRAHVAEYLKPAGAKLFIVGDLTKKQILEKIPSRLKGWSGAPKKSAGAKVAAAAPRKGRLFFSDVPGAQQSVVMALEPGPSRKAPDYFGTHLMEQILGGGFTSRLNMNIREKHGYAYGASGGFQYLRFGSVFAASGSVKTDVTAESLHEIVSELKRIRDEDVSAEELSREKDGDELSLPARWATASSVLGTYQGLLYQGLPLDYYEHYVPTLKAVDAKAVRKGATKHLDLDGMKYVVVGDAKVVLPKLEAMLKSGELGKGELVKLDADARPLAQ